MDKLAVVVDDIHDQRLIARVLIAHNCRFFHRCEWLSKSKDKFNSVIVCHRSSLKAPVPNLPTGHSSSRIIVLSDRTEESIIVNTLVAGAHHYFDIRDSERVLEARIYAALRYHSKRDSLVLDVEPFTFKVDSRTAFYGTRIIDLSPREFELAYYLFSNKSRIVSDAELLTGVWTLPSSLDTRRIDTSICRIKKKMNLNTVQSKWKVVRLRKKGYQVRRMLLSEAN